MTVEAEAGLALHVNGMACETRAAEDTPLLYVFRNDLGLKSPRFGCGTERCGSCVVRVEGKPEY
jgi:aerobic-type carbon monoxide dehydrogenase small subunit (CoxS/CutS family)